MQMQEIKGFPDYMFNADTGEIVSKLQRHTVLKVRNPHNRKSKMVQMLQNGKRRMVYLNRLQYAMRNGIGYDDIPDGFYVIGDNAGGFRVIDRHAMIDFPNSHVRASRKNNRLERVKEKMRELEIMRTIYSGEGDNTLAVNYIESRKSLFINHHKKRYGVKQSTAELCYALALERIIERIDNPCSQVLELTVSMMGLMNKEYTKMRKECPLYTLEEKASNSNSYKV